MKHDAARFDALRSQIHEILAGPADREVKLQAACELLQGSVAHYDWVGFYLVGTAPRELVLGPFVGEPTEHVRIPFGRGVCGQAAERQDSVVVQDVSAQTNYLSCSPKVRSEIVVPILKNGAVVGELDIDSHSLSRFTPADQTFLEDVCRMVATVF